MPFRKYGCDAEKVSIVVVVVVIGGGGVRYAHGLQIVVVILCMDIAIVSFEFFVQDNNGDISLVQAETELLSSVIEREKSKL